MKTGGLTQLEIRRLTQLNRQLARAMQDDREWTREHGAPFRREG